MKRHTITLDEVKTYKIEQVLASSSKEDKSLTFRYDIGRNRTYWIVRIGHREYAADSLDEAVEIYNEEV